MAMTVMNNSTAALALGEFNKNSNKLSDDLKKVSSGMRLNSAGDGTADYAISERMRVLIRSLNQDIDNCKKGIDIVKVAENGIQSIVDELRTMKAMAIDSANDHNSEIDRAIIQKDFANRIEEINDIASETNYNGKILLDGRYYYRESLGIIDNNAEDICVKVNDKIFETNTARLTNKLLTATTPEKLDFNSLRAMRYNTINGFFPEATGRFANVSWPLIDDNKPGVKFTGYGPDRYVIPRKAIYEQKYIVWTTPLGYYDENKNFVAYKTLPPKGTEVVLQDENNGYPWGIRFIMDEELGTHKTIAVATPEYQNNNLLQYIGNSEIKLDFSRLDVNYPNLNYPNDLDGQGFTILCCDCDLSVSIMFDAERSVNDSVYLKDVNTNEAYVIGISEVTNSSELVKALYNGLRLFSDNYHSHANIIGPDRAPVTARDDIFIDKYNENGEELYVMRKEQWRFCIVEGVKGTIKGGNTTATGAEKEPVDEPDPIDEPNPQGTPDDEKETAIDNKREYIVFEGNPLIIHHGPKANQHLRLYINDMHSKAMGLDDVAVDPREKALEAIERLDAALNYALNENTRMGAYQVRLNEIIGTLTTEHENSVASESVIRDSDMAKEMMNYIKDNILTQAAQSMLAQANQNSSSVLSLLQ